MPAFYAHYRFGCDVLSTAQDEIRALCERYRALFDIGLHGPDILFFHKPLIPNTTAKLGHRCHSLTGCDFLIRAKEILRTSANKDASLAYFYGFLCHFALDSVCHPYVSQAMKTYGISHSAAETAFDRALLLTDGIDPIAFDPCGHFHITSENAGIIAPFFPPTASHTVEKSLRSMVFYGRVLYTKNDFLRKTLDLSLYLTFHHDALAGMLMTAKQDLRCAESDRHLTELYAEALLLVPQLFKDAANYIENGQAPGILFERTFKG